MPTKINKLLIFTFILLLPTQLGKHFFLPFSYLSGVRIDYLAPTLYLTDIVVFLLIILNVKELIRHLTNRKVQIFLLLILVNVIFSLSKPLAIYRTIKIGEILAIFLIIKKQPIPAKNLLLAFLMSAGFELILSTLQLINKHSLQGVFYFFGERYLTLSTPDIAKAQLQGVEILRPYGTFSHPNSLAGFYLVVYFFAMTYEKFINYPWLKKILLLITTLLILLSFSKIAIITFLLLNFFHFYQQRKNYNCFLCLFSQITVLLVLSSLFLMSSGDPLSLDKRIILTGNALTIFFRHPFFGVGLGNYLVAQNDFPIKYAYYFLQPVHNIFLLFLAETGIFMTVFVLRELYLFIRNNISRRHLIVIIAVIVTGLFDHYWLTLQQNLLLLPVVFGLLQRHDRVVK